MKKSVIGTIFNPARDQVLAIKRRDVPVWVLPGGGLEDKEDPEEAIIREVYEETGLCVKVKRKVGVYLPINKLGSVTYHFECVVDTGSLTTGSETADLGYFPFEKLPEPFFYIHNDMLHDALDESLPEIEKPLNQVTYLALLKFFVRHPILLIRFALSQIGFPINTISRNKKNPDEVSN